MVGYCGAWGLGGWLLMLGLWAGFIAVVVWAVSRLFPAQPPPAAAEVAAQRQAAPDTALVPERPSIAQIDSPLILSEQLTREQLTGEHLTRDQMTGSARPKEGAR